MNIKDKDYYAFSRPEMIKYVPTNAKKILDVGCSEGNFGRILKERTKCEVLGVELDYSSANRAREILDRVFTGSFEYWVKYFDRVHFKFDCMVFNDSLEHFAYPENILNSIKPLLNKDGTIVASIPNMRYLPVLDDLLFNKNWEYKDSGILDNTHMRFYTINSIKTLFNNAGYDIISIEGINKRDDLVGHANFLSELLQADLSDTVYLQFAVVAKVVNNEYIS